MSRKYPQRAMMGKSARIANNRAPKAVYRDSYKKGYQDALNAMLSVEAVSELKRVLELGDHPRYALEQVVGVLKKRLEE